MTEAAGTQPQITFSIVTAVYNVARYLPEFIGSIDAQTYPHDRLEVIAVNDGSTDASLEILEEWRSRRPDLVQIVTQDNAGLPAARNAGLPFVRGQWVTFADPDDRLSDNCLAEVADFIRAYPDADLVATRMMMLNDATGVLADTHPLRRRFHHGNRVRVLDEYPEYFHGHAPSAFFRVAEIRRQGLSFDPKMRPQFEDGLFCGLYLLGVDDPAVGFVASASYHYRQRSDGSSMQQGIIGKTERYTTVLERGFLTLLRRGSERTGTGLAPEWLQHFILYQVSWFFSSQETHHVLVSATVAPVADTFHELLKEILSYISKDTIRGYRQRRLKPIWEDILLHGYEGQPWHTPYALATRLDSHQGLVRLSYRYIGRPPTEEVRSGGRVVRPRYSKVREIEYLGRVMLRERIMWLSSRQSIRIRLDGQALDLQFWVRRRTHELRPGQVKKHFLPGSSTPTAPRRGWWDRVVARVGRSRPVRRWLRDAWVLMDRITDAGDNAERLMEHLRRERPDINAWFVLRRDSPDWRRLRRTAGRRLVAHGSLFWKVLMLNCQHLMSSHIDIPVVQPPEILRLATPRWRFTFLQHGVTKDDMSGWFNTKSIDLLITATEAEYASIVGDGPYVLTTKEVVLSGFPRFDRLRVLASQTRDAERTLILIAPTWRAELTPLVRYGSLERTIDPGILESEFMRGWLALLAAPELATVAEDSGTVLAFLPHPNMQPALPLMQLPKHVLPLTYADNDVQELFARAAVMVTDYSSTAFDAAYIERPVVYYQFENQRVGGGGLGGRRGYFDYEAHGFGPVASTVEQAIDAIRDALRSGKQPAPRYLTRIREAFPRRDGRACERAVAAIEAQTRRLSVEETIVHASAAPATDG